MLRWDETEGGPTMENLLDGWSRASNRAEPGRNRPGGAECLAGHRWFSLGRESGDRAWGEERGPVVWAEGAKRREESCEAGTKV